ncbi:MAG TPA: hypothetical protein VK151_09440 [Fluviicola sp.]|nr:hypothetical protein [Fluviicola sp.]
MKRLITTIALFIASHSFSQDYTYGSMSYWQDGAKVTEELKEGEIDVMLEEGWIYITFPDYQTEQWKMKIVKEEKKDNGDIFYPCLAADKSEVFIMYCADSNEFVLRMDDKNQIVFQRIKKS